MPIAHRDLVIRANSGKSVINLQNMKQIYNVPNVVINGIMLVLPTKFKSIKTLNSGHGHNIYIPINYIYIFWLRPI